MSDDQKAHVPPSQSHLSDNETRPLPEGWIKQFDPRSNAWFYVDTKATPPRSIWVHPLDDHEFLARHPEYNNYDNPPHYEEASRPATTPSASSDKGRAPERRGFLGHLKDKAIGRKEEREEMKRIREQERRQRHERLAQRRAHAAQYGAPPQLHQYPGGYVQGQPAYGYGQPIYGQPGLAPPRRSGLGGGAALPLLGGLAGGLLLGDIIGGDGFGGDGGDWGGDGGDFGGGDFGGGDF